MRLDKFIGNNTHYSRAEIKQLVRARRVSVNAEIVTSSALKIGLGDHEVAIDGTAVVPAGEVYLMLHKPKGYLCANTDSQHPTVIDLLKNTKNHCRNSEQTAIPPTAELQIAGRLDIDTTGLVLLTTNGQWNHRLTAPASNCNKIYLVTLAEPIASNTITMFASGILLKGEAKPTRPASVEVITPYELIVGLSEGKYHQVKRMFAAVGNQVVSLHRQAIGAIALDSQLLPGQFRYLTATEINCIQ